MRNTDTDAKYVTRYAATINTPGYLPDSTDDLLVFYTAAEAWEYLRDERERELDDAAMSDDCEDPDCQWRSEFDYTDDDAYAAMMGADDGSGDVYGATPGYHGSHDLGRVYSVTPVIVPAPVDETIVTSDDVRAFAESYLGTLLWSGAYFCEGPCEHAEDFAGVEPGEAIDCPGHNLDDHYDVDDFAPNARATSEADCRDFVLSMVQDLPTTGADWGQHGHDFALTRNGHGAGFWARGYGAVGDRLSEAAQSFGEVDVYPGDDGRLHL